MQIGRRIFYDLITGEIIVDTGQRSASVYGKSVEQDVRSYIALLERKPDSFGVIELEYNQFIQDFNECNGVRINPETKELEFSYPDPNEPETPQVYQPPLSEQINDQMDYLVDLDFRLMQIELGF